MIFEHKKIKIIFKNKDLEEKSKSLLNIIKNPQFEHLNLEFLVQETQTSVTHYHNSQKHKIHLGLADSKLNWQCEQITQSRSLLGQALGVYKSHKALKVIDATAGLGRDALVMTALGCEVTLFEKNPLLQFLLKDLNLKLIAKTFQADSAKNLDADCIYLDPMFEERQKSAQVKKESFFLQSITNYNAEGNDELIQAALKSSVSRVLVKRALNAPILASKFVGKPTIQFKGKTIRYDIYLLPM